MNDVSAVNTSTKDIYGMASMLFMSASFIISTFLFLTIVPTPLIAADQALDAVVDEVV